MTLIGVIPIGNHRRVPSNDNGTEYIHSAKKEDQDNGTVWKNGSRLLHVYH